MPTFYLDTSALLKRYKTEVLERSHEKLVLVADDDELCTTAKHEHLEAVNPREKDALKHLERLVKSR